MTMVWVLAPETSMVDARDVLGLLPAFLSDADPRPAVEQIAENYSGGWDSFKGIEIDAKDNFALNYPGDPSSYPLAYAKLRRELVILYPSDWVAVLAYDPDTRDYEVARIS